MQMLNFSTFVCYYMFCTSVWGRRVVQRDLNALTFDPPGNPSAGTGLVGLTSPNSGSNVKDSKPVLQRQRRFWDGDPDSTPERPPDPFPCEGGKQQYCCVDPDLLVSHEDNICLRWLSQVLTTLCEIGKKACCDGIKFGADIVFREPRMEDDSYVGEEDKSFLGRAYGCEFVEDALDTAKEFLRQLDQAGAQPLLRFEDIRIPILGIPGIGALDGGGG